MFNHVCQIYYAVGNCNKTDNYYHYYQFRINASAMAARWTGGNSDPFLRL